MDNAVDKWADRYSRQTKFAAIGEAGQRLISEATVLIVGSGALGASLAQHLTRAGVKKIKLIDRDYVEPSNLQRQMLFTEEDAMTMMPKAVAARQALERINHAVEIEAIVTEVNHSNVDQFVREVSLVLDGTDNAATRLLLSDSCYRQGIPYLFGGVAGAEGMSAMFIPGRTACLRCVMGDEMLESPADTCDTIGVLSPAVEMVVALQITEALKWLTKNEEALHGEWISFNLWSLHIRRSRMPQQVMECSYCGGQQAASIDHLLTTDTSRTQNNARYKAAVLCGRDSIQLTLAAELEFSALIDQLRARGCTVFQNKYLWKATVPTGERLVIFADSRILVQGTNDIETAYKLCEQYLII